MRSHRYPRSHLAPRSAFAGYRFPPEVITLAVRWYLRFGLSYRDVEELLAERGIEVDHVTVYRWVQRFAPEFAEAARARQHGPSRAPATVSTVKAGNSCPGPSPLATEPGASRSRSPRGRRSRQPRPPRRPLSHRRRPSSGPTSPSSSGILARGSRHRQMGSAFGESPPSRPGDPKRHVFVPRATRGGHGGATLERPNRRQGDRLVHRVDDRMIHEYGVTA